MRGKSGILYFMFYEIELCSRYGQISVHDV